MFLRRLKKDHILFSIGECKIAGTFCSQYLFFLWQWSLFSLTDPSLTILLLLFLNREFLFISINQSFPNSTLLTFWLDFFFFFNLECCFVYCRWFSSTPSLYPPDASSSPQVVTTKMPLGITTVPLVCKITPAHYMKSTSDLFPLSQPSLAISISHF